MLLSVSTANLYMVPFEKVLEMYRKAGFQYIELAGHWQGGAWEVAQHLRGVPPRDVLSMVRDSGLQIATFHDMGGLIEGDAKSVVSPLTYEYLEREAFPCLVFHSPHMKDADANWWRENRAAIIDGLAPLEQSSIVCIENMPPLEGHYMPLVEPRALRDFLEETGFFANLDTTHCAQAGMELRDVAEALGDRIKTVHLSDCGEKTHAPIGTGTMELAPFVRGLDAAKVYAITIESDLWASDEQQIIANAIKARELVTEMMGESALS